MAEQQNERGNQPVNRGPDRDEQGRPVPGSGAPEMGPDGRRVHPRGKVRDPKEPDDDQQPEDGSDMVRDPVTGQATNEPQPVDRVTGQPTQGGDAANPDGSKPAGGEGNGAQK